MSSCTHKKLVTTHYGKYECPQCGVDLTDPSRSFTTTIGRSVVRSGDPVRVSYLGPCRWLYYSQSDGVHCVTQGTHAAPTKRIRFVRADRVHTLPKR